MAVFHRPRRRRRPLLWAATALVYYLLGCSLTRAEDSVATATASSSSAASSSTTASSSSYASNSDKGLQAVQRVCRADGIIVKKLLLLCDSPGAYYYGSNTYRNSPVCMSGDRATLRVHFTVANRLNETNGVHLTVQAGIYDTYATVLSRVPLCHLGVSSGNGGNDADNGGSSTDDGGVDQDGSDESCPPVAAGDYVLRTSFRVPAIRDYNLHYTPDLKLTFVGTGGTTSSSSGHAALLGCAATGTLARYQRGRDRARHGLLALGLCTGLLAALFGALLLAGYHRKLALRQRLREQRASRYYIQTRPNGNVVTDDEEEGRGNAATTMAHRGMDPRIPHPLRMPPQQPRQLSGAVPFDEDESSTSSRSEPPVRPVI